MMAKTQKIKNILSYLFICIIFCSCSKNKNELKDNDLNVIVDSMYKHQHYINFKDIIKTQWDRMYILDVENFPELSNKSDISKIIGVNYNGCKEDVLDRSILFVNNDKIICEICSNFKETNWDDSQYYINFVPNKNIKYFTPKNSVFKIEKKSGEGYNLIYDVSASPYINSKH